MAVRVLHEAEIFRVELRNPTPQTFSTSLRLDGDGGMLSLRLAD